MDAKRRLWTKDELAMGTTVRIQVATTEPQMAVNEAMNNAIRTIRMVEKTCSRFDPNSELMQLCRTHNKVVQVSPILFEATQFAIEVARATDGVFDPTIGATMAAFGFNRHYLTGELVEPPVQEPLSDDMIASASFRDIVLNAEARSICLLRPLQLDLGAVAKGMAVDLAARELHQFDGFVVNAGGDLYAAGTNESGEPWEVAIQHPTRPSETIYHLRLSDVAVCTSGSYERRSPNYASPTSPIHHIVHPETKESRWDVVSCTAIGPFAMLADAFSTAAFLLGSTKGLPLLESVELDGLMITEDLKIYTTDSIERYRHGSAQ